MEKYSRQSESFAEERASYRHDVAILEATEGYRRLTKKQRQIIRMSLYVQDRAERGMDPSHKNDPWYFDWLQNDKKAQPYSLSLNHIRKWYCHPAIAALEAGKVVGERPQNCPLEFFDGAYFEFHHEFEIKKAVEFFGFPCIVHVSHELGNSLGEYGKYHTFLALGHDRENNIVTWEKIRIQAPYRLTTLSQVFSEYKSVGYWGFKKLR